MTLPKRKRRKSRGFNEVEEAFLRECVQHGVSVRYCAIRLGRSESGVTSHAAKLGLHFLNRKTIRKEPARYG